MSLQKITNISWLCLAVLVLLISFRNTKAIPSFARQTNLACSSCHTIFPELNAFGRIFKLNGYTLTNLETIKAQADSETTTLSLLKTSNVSSMLITSYSYKSKEQPGTQNGNISLPQQLSLFLGGEITPQVGGFIQITYSDQDGSFGLDNSEIRYVNQTELASESFTYGLTINNNPSMQDIWNSTPAWRFPYSSSSVSPTPIGETLIEGGLAQNVAGLGFYSMWNNLIYAEFSVYKSAQQGSISPPDSSSSGILKSLAPYWRIALQKQWEDFYLQIGTYGLSASLFPSGIAGLTDRYNDIGFDINIEKYFGTDIFTAHGSWTHESRTLDATFNSGNSAFNTGKLNSFRFVGNYYLHQQIGFSLGYFSISGDSDSGLYPQESVSGSSTGLPDSNGCIVEFSCLPWLNTKLSVQYVAYNKFNGAINNYDGQGRNASDNNTLYISCWLAF